MQLLTLVLIIWTVFTLGGLIIIFAEMKYFKSVSDTEVLEMNQSQNTLHSRILELENDSNQTLYQLNNHLNEKIKKLTTELHTIKKEHRKDLDSVKQDMDRGNEDDSFDKFESKLFNLDLTITNVQLQQKQVTDEIHQKNDLQDAEIHDMVKNVTEIREQLHASHFATDEKLSALDVKMTDLDQKISEVLSYKTFSGHMSSIFEGERSSDIQVAGCGGILVGSHGTIIYDEDQEHHPFLCIWTVRANRHSNVSMRLVTSDLSDDSYITLSPLKDKLEVSNDPLSNQTIILSKHSETLEHTLAGPVIFVTLIVNSTSNHKSRFTLKFQGEGESSYMKYSHYHYRSDRGSIEYPKLRGTTTYLPNEVVTFVVNPPIPNGGYIFPHIKSLHTENATHCEYDSLGIWKWTGGADMLYYKFGPAHSNHIFCGSWDTPFERKSWHESQHFLVVFKSDESNEGNGFHLDWESLNESDDVVLHTEIEEENHKEPTDHQEHDVNNELYENQEGEQHNEYKEHTHDQENTNDQEHPLEPHQLSGPSEADDYLHHEEHNNT